MKNELVLKVRRTAELLREWRETYPNKSPKCNDFFNILKRNGIKLNFSYHPKIVINEHPESDCEFMSACGGNDYELIDNKNTKTKYSIGQTIDVDGWWKVEIVAIEMGLIFYKFLYHSKGKYVGATSSINIGEFESIIANR